VTAILAWGFLDQHHADADADADEFDPHYSHRDAAAALGAAVERTVGPATAASVEQRAVCDLPAPALLDAAAGAELLVVGARGLGGFRGLLLGSVSQHCLHHVTCPVAIVRTGATTSGGHIMERIVVGIDGSESSRRALRWAVDEARVRDAALEVVHTWHMPYVSGFPYVAATLDPSTFEDPARKLVDDMLAGVDTTGLSQPVERIVVCGGAASTLLESAKGADMLVVGSRGLGGFSGLLLGSVSHHVAHHATCPVVIVPAES
jgi:nucleotide-binding universal stress UspA family protein